jgi:hypothetical protein
MNEEQARKHLHDLVDVLFDSYINNSTKDKGPDFLVRATYVIGDIYTSQIFPGHILAILGKRTAAFCSIAELINRLDKQDRIETVVDKGRPTIELTRMKRHE